MPEMVFVDSSNIEAIGYDASTSELHVRFSKGGADYVFFNVEEWVYQEFLRADSKGRYFWQNVRERYSYSKL